MCDIAKFLQLAHYEPLMHVLIPICNVLIWHICVFRHRWWCKEGVCSCTHTCACLHPHAHEYVFPGHSHSSLSSCTGKTWSLAHEHVLIIHDKSQKSFKGVNIEKSMKSCIINVKNVLVFRQKNPPKQNKETLTNPSCLITNQKPSVPSIQVPVPVFLPTTLQGAEQIIEAINELKNKVPSELLSMAETITEDQKPGTLVWGSGVWFKTLEIRDVMKRMLMENLKVTRRSTVKVLCL